MTGQIENDTSPNLGRYSIRAPEDLTVGAFYKRKQSDSINRCSGNQLSGSLPKKRRLLTGSEVPNQSDSRFGGSMTSSTASHDLDSVLSKSQMIIEENSLNEDHNNNDDRLFSNNSASINPSRRVQSYNSSIDRSTLSKTPPALILDTQSYTYPTEGNQDSHESLLVDINPETFLTSDDETTITSIKPSEELDFSLRSPDEPRVQKRLKIYPIQLPYEKIMSGVVFVMSGIENPRRSHLRDMATKMGAKYEPKWNRFCTHLICAFKFTAKYVEVMAENGRIVREHWIQGCSRQRQLLDWRNYKLGDYPYPDSEEEVDDFN